jgi:AbrB family looped-hinge helix DNA binding protein
MMERSRLTIKGQITIPKGVRDRLGLRPGDEVVFVEANGEIRIEKLVHISPFARYRGYLRHLAGQDPDHVLDELRGRAEQ